MPQSFKNDYPHTRVIIDCTELFIETRSQPRTQSATFSTYKDHNTGKGLIGISPKGDLTFVSEMYAGNTSDKQLTNDCGIMKFLEPGDEVMVNRAFEIEENLPPDEVSFTFTHRPFPSFFVFLIGVLGESQVLKQQSLLCTIFSGDVPFLYFLGACFFIRYI